MITGDIKAYACNNLDRDIRYNSTSGGIFLALCKGIIDMGGYVVGVEFDDDYKPTHKIVSNYNECVKFSGSKYPQSDTGLIYNSVKDLLNQGETVLFSGTPCQNAALRLFLQKKYDNLYCVEVICMGVASPYLWECYLKNEYSNVPISHIRFKDKKYGWKKYSVHIVTKNKEIYEVGGRNTFMNSYVSGYQMRDSCYKCQFKGNNRFSDITIGDCWGIENILPEWDTFSGVSVACINSEQGRKLFDKVKYLLKWEEIPVEKAMEKNPYYFVSKERPRFHDLFWDLFKKNRKLFFWFYNAHSLHYRILRRIKYKLNLN